MVVLVVGHSAVVLRLTSVLAVADAMATDASLTGKLLAVNYHGGDNEIANCRGL